METTLMKGGQVSKGEIDTEFLGDIVRVRLLRHAVRMYEHNQRAGTHSTKSRGDLSFTKKKYDMATLILYFMHLIND